MLDGLGDRAAPEQPADVQPAGVQAASADDARAGGADRAPLAAPPQRSGAPERHRLPRADFGFRSDVAAVSDRPDRSDRGPGDGPAGEAAGPAQQGGVAPRTLDAALDGLPAVVRAAIGQEAVVVIAQASAEPRRTLPLAHASEVVVSSLSPAEMVDKVERIAGDPGCIVIDGPLQNDADYRGLLSAAFARLVPGGFLLAVVPSQFLYERKLQVPSRLPTKYAKFYTHSTLLSELEEALSPFDYRLRHMGDFDAGYDGSVLAAVPQGHAEILCLIEKVSTPAWAGALEREDRQTAHSPVPTPFLAPKASSPAVVVAPANAEVASVRVVALDHRGDFVMGMDARRSLRRLFPQARMTLLCGRWNRGEATKSKLFDEIIDFDYFAEDASAKADSVSKQVLERRLVTALGERTFDLAVDLRLHGDTRDLLRSVAARVKAGFDNSDEFPWLDIRMFAINPERASRARQTFMPAHLFHTAGEHRYLDILVPADVCRARGRDTIVWGGYTDFPSGRYEIGIKVRSASNVTLGYDVCCNSGNDILSAGSLSIGLHAQPTVILNLFEDVRQLEVRLYANPDIAAPLTFSGLHVVKRASEVGLHQRESMNLLVQLIAMRMEHPTVAKIV